MSLTTIGMWENRKRKNLSLWQIGCTMCTTGIPDLLAAKGLKLMILYHAWPWGYKTFFMLNSAEHEISVAHKKLNVENT